MISIFLKEQEKYTQADLRSKLGCSSDEDFKSIVRELKRLGYLKYAKNLTDLQNDISELTDEYIEVEYNEADDTNRRYVFTFVGVIVVDGRVLKCYPKYISAYDNDEQEDSEEEQKGPIEELRQVFKVIEKYNSKKNVQPITMFNDSSDKGFFNLLAVLLFLIHDYYENGVYSNTEDIIESNGAGEIIWDKTINETFVFLSDNRPYYIDLKTKKRVTNDFDYFKRLHECVLTKASKELEDAQLLTLFEITAIDLTDEELDDFGDDEYILYRLENELCTQFNTRKQLVLKTLIAYIKNRPGLNDTDCLYAFGTKSFNLVWEDVCKDILDNQLNKKLKDLPLDLNQKYKDGEYKGKKLIDLIEKPYWTITRNRAKDTLIPDLVTIDGDRFIIFDAKYYNAKLIPGQPPKGQPGIESITKQYLYQLAFQDFINDHEFKSVKNCFLMPTEKPDDKNKGEVRMEMLSKLGLEDIKVRFLPAKEAYNYYLSGKKLNITSLELDKPKE